MMQLRPSHKKRDYSSKAIEIRPPFSGKLPTLVTLRGVN